MDTKAFNDGYDARLGGYFSPPHKYRVDGLNDWLVGWKEADLDMKKWNPSVVDGGFKINYWFDDEEDNIFIMILYKDKAK